MDKTLPAGLSICRFQGGKRETGVSIRVVDQISHCCVLEIEMSVEEFGHAVLGLSERPCEAQWRTKNLGLKYEHKTEAVPYDNFSNKQTKEQALKPFEIDGWKGRLEDLGNGHKSAGNHAYHVVFVRYVKEGE
jgi:hypothetical protein